MSQHYLAPAARSEGEVREKGSRFVASIAPAPDERTARAVLDELARAHPDASHHCWAWRIGWPAAERASDAGEPHGTAGQPILRVLQGAELTDIVAVVVRWFGGTKLGKGGLARAYAAAAGAALDGLPTRRRFVRRRVRLTVPYDKLGAVQRFVQPPEVEIVSGRYGEAAELELAVVEERLEALRELAGALGISSAETGPMVD